MKKHSTVILLIILSCIATIYASVELSLAVKSNGDSASLSWSVSGVTLSDQQKFSIQRKTPQTDYQELTTIPAYSSTYSYSYTDKTAYKTSDVLYTYRIQLVDASANFSYNYVYGSVTGGALISTSSVKKTWGSIKAMFR
jgi:hypothetical protein